MNIGMILEHSFRSDVRVEREARSLTEKGHQIFVLCPYEKGLKHLEKRDYCTVVRVKLPKFSLFHLISFLSLNFSHYHPFWYRHIKWFVRTFKIQVLHVHDLPYLKTALLAAKREIPVIADLHEVYPEALQIWSEFLFLTNNFVVKSVIRNFNRWKRFEGESLKAVYKIISIVDETKKRLVDNYLIPPEKIIIISNYISKNSTNFIEPTQNCTKWNYITNKFAITHIGRYGAYRGLETTLKALKLLKDKIPDLLFLLVGRGPPYYDEYLKSLIEALDVSDVVQMQEWVPFEEIPCILHASKAGIIPFSPYSAQMNFACPNKLFQYMLAKTPLIVSSCQSLKRIIKETNSGVVFDADNAVSLAKTIETLYKNPDLLKKLGENGQKAVLNGKHNWEEDAKKLINMYNELEKKLKDR